MSTLTRASLEEALQQCRGCELYRGATQVVPVEHPPSWVSATIHPSTVLRAHDRDDMLAGLVEDLASARAALERDG